MKGVAVNNTALLNVFLEVWSPAIPENTFHALQIKPPAIKPLSIALFFILKAQFQMATVSLNSFHYL